MFLLLHRVNYQKKVLLGTGNELQVPIPYRFKYERYPTLGCDTIYCDTLQYCKQADILGYFLF